MIVWIKLLCLASVFCHALYASQKRQDPVPPYPYAEEEVQFGFGEVQLSGTLTYPSAGSQGVGVVLVSGSGPQNRDEEILGHRPFLVLADYLTRQGFTVLRYDDRGVGKSTGNFVTGTSRDFCDDAMHALRFLRSHAPGLRKVGILGHSEGGMIAFMAAARKNAPDFVVSLAASVVPMERILVQQRRSVYQIMGMDPAMIDNLESHHAGLVQLSKTGASDEDILRAAVTMVRQAVPITGYDKNTRNLRVQMLQQQIRAVARAYQTPWFRFVLGYDALPDLENTRCPVLALNGELDQQVNAQENLELIQSVVSRNNPYVIVKNLKGLNHLFQTAKTGRVDEYASLEETFSPVALRIIGNWLDSQANEAMH